MRFKRPSLRTKLAATVLVAFVMMVVTGLENIYVAGEAREAVETARRNHRLVAAYGELGYQAARVEAEAWETVFSGSERRSPAELAARARLLVLLEESRAAAAAVGPRQNAANAAIRARVPAMLAGYDRIAEFARYMDQGGFLRGTPEFENRTDQIFLPHERFRDALEAEVDAGSARLTAATERGARLTRLLNIAGWASLALGVLITAFLLVLILKRLRGGLDRLERGARAFGQGDLGCGIGLGGGDELAQVAHAFDAMAQELSDKQRALQEAKSGLEAAVAARPAATALAWASRWSEPWLRPMAAPPAWSPPPAAARAVVRLPVAARSSAPPPAVEGAAAPQGEAAARQPLEAAE